MIDASIIIAFAALIHASFQLSVSMLTVLSGHAIGRKSSHSKLLRITNSFTLGVAIMTAFVLSFLVFIFRYTFPNTIPEFAWIVSCGLLLGVGIIVWRYYYRHEPGTSLWIPRSMARYLSERSKATRRSTEAFGLGMSSVIGELLFIIAPMAVTSLVILQLDPGLQPAGVVFYTLVSLLPLALVNGLIGSGHKLSSIQKWRETNKRFLQFIAGSGLLILGAYLYVENVITMTVTAPGAL